MIISNVPPFHLHPPSLHAEHGLYGMGHPLGQLGSAILALSFPNFLCTSSLLTGGVGWGAEKALTRYKCGLATMKQYLYYQHYFERKS